ncbi:MAG TPA: hypothetical protein VG309_11660 [Rhizomicrobium sp.]|nr:hypothetical protein [Rhizomicrobium sp.]
MRAVALACGVAVFASVLLGGADELPDPVPSQAPSTPQQSSDTQITPAPVEAAEQKIVTSPEIAAYSPSIYKIRYDRWTTEDERGFGEFITAIGESRCHTVNDCLHSLGNPFRKSDPAGIYFRSDCADLPYVLRAYYAWKRGLPFSYVSEVSPRGHTRDIRYTPDGNEVVERHDVLSNSISGYELLDVIRDAVSSATYRIHPDLDDPVPDTYSPLIDSKSIRPGTMIYDPNGHVGTVFKVEADGSIQYIDAHPDNSLTRGYYDERFVRSRPGMGAGFKNWRSPMLTGATRSADGEFTGGHVVLPKNKDIPDFSDEQYYGTGAHPAGDGLWSTGGFAINGETYTYYDFVRAAMAGGKLQFDPLKEVRQMVESDCNDLQYRADAVTLAIEARLENQPQPARLPANIYGTEGDWETYSTPSRDARLKTAFRELRDQTERFVKMYQTHDKKLVYEGHDVVADLIATYDGEASKCRISYTRTDGSQVSFGFAEAIKRLFRMSFDPYQCVERRWGASDAAELSTCHDGANKQAWYAAEQNLRNQLDRTYDAQMDFTLEELGTPGAGKGVPAPPDVDTRGYLGRLAAGEQASLR